MRVCVDTNILIGYLLAPSGSSPPLRIVNAGIRNMFTLVIASPTFSELRDEVRSKPYLTDRISTERVDAFVRVLHFVAEIIDVPETIPNVTRDPRDDYLVAPAVIEHVNIVVSGDKDLLVLINIAGVEIMAPVEFAARLDREIQS